jgi:transposase
VPKGGCVEANHIEGREVSTIGLDIAKTVFQVHGVDGASAVVIRKRISRVKMLEFFAGLPPCLVGIESAQSIRASGRTCRINRPDT